VATIYAAFLDTVPPPKVEFRWPFAWQLVWRRLWASNLPPLLVDRYFMLLHNILPLRGRLVEFGLEACGPCGGLEDVQHFFQRCPLVADLWEGLYFKLVGLMPGLPSDFKLLMLAFPAVPAAVERLMVAHLGVFVAEWWESRSLLRLPSRRDLAAAFRAHFPALRPLF
jgi:hypothetical protein